MKWYPIIINYPLSILNDYHGEGIIFISDTKEKRGLQKLKYEEDTVTIFWGTSKMSIENWISLLVPLISVVVAIISAGLSYYFAKRQQVNADERRLKEKYYQDYINAISKVAIDNSDERAKDELANAHNTLPLIGSADVVYCAMDFHDYIKESNKQNFSIDEHDKKLRKLVMAMRSDLYKTKKINNKYPPIHLCGSGKSNKVSEKMKR